MGKILIIAEKPSVATAIKDAIATTGENFITKDSGAYYESATYYITAAAGHLFELQDMEYYEGQQKKWTLEALPFIPKKYEYVPIQSKAKKIATIKNLMANADEVVHACDPAREGQIIGDIILKKLEYKGKVTRLMASDIEKKTILEQMDKRRPNSEYDLVSKEGFTRSIADWSYGINLSRYATLKSGTLLNVGRVVGAIVAIICEREREIRNFVPKPFWQLEFPLSEEIKLSSKIKNETREEGQAQLDKYNAAKTYVKKITEKEVTKTPPKLFSQTKLQNACSDAYGWTPDKTLQVSQTLYEKGYTTYPRTDSEYMSENEKDKVKRIIANHKIPHLVFKDVKRIFDNSKVAEHSAITPTSKVPKFADNEEDEKKCYAVIMNRFIVNFYDEDYIVNKTELEIEVVDGVESYEVLTTSGEIVKQKGWSVYEKEKADKILPPLTEGQILTGLWECVEKKTSPPKHYTVTTLNNTLEKPFKNDNDSEDEEYRKLRLGVSIGTDATRAGIIKKAIANGYISLNKKNYGIEEKGEYLCDTLKELKIDMTKEKTVELSQIITSVGRGDIHINAALSKVYEEISWIIAQNITPTPGMFGVLGQCPICKQAVMEGQKAYYCSNKECKFVLSKFIANKAISKKEVQKMLKDGHTSLIKGFTGKSGKKFDAVIALKDDLTGIEFRFNALSDGNELLCPICQNPIRENKKAFFCTNRDCDFVIWNSYAGRKITPSIVRKIVTTGDSGKISGFKSKKENAKAKTFSARLVLTQDKKGIEMKFD